ncbi:Mobile element protein, partial [Methylomonas albis]
WANVTSRPFMASDCKHGTMPNTMSSNTSKCITIGNSFIQNWDIYPLKPLNLNMPL